MNSIGIMQCGSSVQQQIEDVPCRRHSCARKSEKGNNRLWFLDKERALGIRNTIYSIHTCVATFWRVFSKSNNVIDLGHNEQI